MFTEPFSSRFSISPIACLEILHANVNFFRKFFIRWEWNVWQKTRKML